jgi:hypothetical protein
VEWVVREGLGAGGEMTQALYAHMNNKRKKRKLGIYKTQQRFKLYQYRKPPDYKDEQQGRKKGTKNM